MGADGGLSDGDPWHEACDLGTSATWRFRGAAGLERLTGPFSVTADPPERFAARLTRVQLDHVAIEAFDASPHRFARTPAEILAHPAPILSFLRLVEGRATVELAGCSFEWLAGESLLVDSRDETAWTCTSSTRLLRAVVGLEHVPAALQRRGATVPAVLRGTPLVESHVAFIASILSTAASGRRARGDQLIQAVAELQCAVLAEAQQLRLTRGGTEGLRHRMQQWIDAHHSDPDLDPAAVARVFGISLRQAHAVFAGEDRTIARSIRDRRLEAVAAELRGADDVARLSELARRHGFRNPDTLSRAFRQRFGATPTEYRTDGHRHLG